MMDHNRLKNGASSMELTKSARPADPAYPDTRFAVISDLHFYDASLGMSGPAFEVSVREADTVFSESAGLLEMAIDEILAAGVRFVLVPGDLTKDGEAASHRRLPSVLSRLTANGVGVYVIPGNHDMNNPRAFRHEGGERIFDGSVSPEAFARLYEPFGYGQALLRHDDSLSYVAEPVPGLWLLGIDATLSRFNQPGGEEIIGAKVTPSLQGWLSDILAQARAQGKAVIGQVHHGVVEHWRGQGKIHPAFLLADYPAIGRMLAAAGVRLVFTGHYHAQDITRGDFGADGFLYDVETGSLTAPPCPVRICTLQDGRIRFESLRLAGRYQPESGYAARATAHIRASVERQAFQAARRYRVSERDARYLAGHIATAFQAHYDGDEDPVRQPPFDTRQLSLWGRFIYSRQKFVLDGLWQDLPPADDNVTLDLSAPG